MNLVEPELFSFRRCPYAIRARMALYASGQSFHVSEVSLRNKPERLIALSPKATVPVLVLSDGRVIDESLDIMRWALAQSDPLGWLSRSGTQQAMELLVRNDGPFKHWLDRYKYPGRYADADTADTDPDAKPDAKPDAGNCTIVAREHAMQVLINPLGSLLNSQPFIGGDDASVEDVAIFPFVRQFSGVEPAWFATHVPRSVQDWLATWLRSALFEQVMQKQPVS